MKLLDGGLSTVLEEMGEHPSGLLWTAAALVDRPDILVEAHRRFVAAGADIVISASYQASVPGLVRAGLSETDARAALASTTDLARQSGASEVACSVGPYGACLGDGSEYHGRYAAGWDEVRAFHRARLEVLVPTAPDWFAIETIPTRAEADIIVEELRRFTDAPAWVSFTCADAERTHGGDRLADAAAGIAPVVQAVGVNCTAPELVTELLESIDCGLPLVAYPNHGRQWDGIRSCWTGPPPSLTTDLPAWIAAGAQYIGGCCGVGTDGIAALARARDALAG